MVNSLTRVEVSVAADWYSATDIFKKMLAQRLPALIAEIAEFSSVTPTRIQIVANPKGGGKG